MCATNGNEEDVGAIRARLMKNMKNEDISFAAMAQELNIWLHAVEEKGDAAVDLMEMYLGITAMLFLCLKREEDSAEDEAALRQLGPIADRIHQRLLSKQGLDMRDTTDYFTNLIVDYEHKEIRRMLDDPVSEENLLSIVENVIDKEGPLVEHRVAVLIWLGAEDQALNVCRWLTAALLQTGFRGSTIRDNLWYKMENRMLKFRLLLEFAHDCTAELCHLCKSDRGRNMPKILKAVVEIRDELERSPRFPENAHECSIFEIALHRTGWEFVSWFYWFLVEHSGNAAICPEKMEAVEGFVEAERKLWENDSHRRTSTTRKLLEYVGDFEYIRRYLETIEDTPPEFMDIVKLYLLALGRKYMDLVHLEATACHDRQEEVKEQLALLLEQLSAYHFSDAPLVCREFALSAFSLSPTSDRLDALDFMATGGKKATEPRATPRVSRPPPGTGLDENANYFMVEPAECPAWVDYSRTDPGDDPTSDAFEASMDALTSHLEASEWVGRRRQGQPLQDVDLRCLNLEPVGDVKRAKDYQPACVHPDSCTLGLNPTVKNERPDQEGTSEACPRSPINAVNFLTVNYVLSYMRENGTDDVASMDLVTILTKNRHWSLTWALGWFPLKRACEAYQRLQDAKRAARSARAQTGAGAGTAGDDFEFGLFEAATQTLAEAAAAAEDADAGHGHEHEDDHEDEKLEQDLDAFPTVRMCQRVFDHDDDCESEWEDEDVDEEEEPEPSAAAAAAPPPPRTPETRRSVRDAVEAMDAAVAAATERDVEKEDDMFSRLFISEDSVWGGPPAWRRGESFGLIRCVPRPANDEVVCWDAVGPKRRRIEDARDDFMIFVRKTAAPPPSPIPLVDGPGNP